MNSKVKAALQYLIMILITGGLLWLSLRSLGPGEGSSKTDFLWATWQKSSKLFLWLMALVAMASHLLRAYRWKLLLVPTGNVIGLGSSFLSLMIGYLVNLAIPRGGEVSRCYNLFKLEKTPVEVSFGTVVAERVVDVICLLLLLLVSFWVEWDKLQSFISTLNFSSGNGFVIPLWAIIAAVLVMGMIAAIFFFRKNKKLKKIIAGFKEGLLSIFRLKNAFLFIVISISIWLLYFLMTYCVILAFPETEAFGASAVITIFAIGAIAMAAPLPGGAGSYHTLVPLGLVMLYHMPQTEAVAFVFIFHAWQTIIMIVGGVVSLFISYLILRWKKPISK